MKGFHPLLWTASILGVAFVVNVMGIELAGGIEAWRKWLERSSTVFRGWRIGLYAALGYGAFRLYRSHFSNGQQRALRRTAVAAVLVLTLLEIHSLKLLP
ncbi:hypothetical protein FEM54_26965 [Pseudomonas edaphica]|uniref:DUF1294 domain-containing protein n=1 Tax=Pseudomonas edaphica TaxID=2006980 RepID=A0ABY2TXM0_9PSED|nr:hypothetical protein [Pseudomonas edaphica]TLG88304.1 hypothetical protein FEM54_26965 [Pseudomonas edaphica]